MTRTPEEKVRSIMPARTAGNSFTACITLRAGLPLVCSAAAKTREIRAVQLEMSKTGL